MQRLVLQFYGKEFERIWGQSPFRNVKSMELLHFLRFDKDELAAICRIYFNDPGEGMESLPLDEREGRVGEVQLLEKTEDGSFVVFLRRKRQPDAFGLNFSAGGGYLFTPFEIRDRKFKIGFLGSRAQIKEFLESVDARGFQYRILSMATTDFSPDSPLNCLTNKQRATMISAFKLGYYDVPRKINSDQLAAHLGRANSTVVQHIRKAERRLLVEILNESKGRFERGQGTQ